MKPELVQKNLQRSILFKDADSSELKTFSEASFVSIVPKGEFVYKQGESSDTFFVIALGEAELFVECDDSSQGSVGRIGPGGHFGETTILTGKSRSLSVKALFDLVLICFDKVTFLELLLRNPKIHKQLDVTLAERLQVAFMGQAEVKNRKRPEDQARFEDVLLFKGDDQEIPLGVGSSPVDRKEEVWKSKTAKLTQRVIDKFAKNNDPYLLTGESGTGKRMITRQIHCQSENEAGMYQEFDLRDYSSDAIAEKLFGREKDNLPFFQMGQTGILEQSCGGTVVFLHAQLMKYDLQQRLLNAIKSGIYFREDSDEQIALQCRLVFVCTREIEKLQKTDCFLPQLWKHLIPQHFRVPALKEHKRDLPRFINYYLDRYSKEYGKNIHRVSKDTLGLLMNYDWPGNLSELSSVLKRAVMLSKKDEIITDQILLGLPKTEGKWEFNLLRISAIRHFFESKAYPLVPQIIVGIILLFAVSMLFFGPAEADDNIGITISWALGWPLLFISFFVLARTWCSVCTLATPGILLQALAKPKRKTPRIIKENSGWIMAVLCIIVMWVEIVWNAYDSPFLSGCIILAITIGSMIFSVLYTRRAWCRYLCPLGAINAIFAMPSILELRSNRHLCLNRCTQHSCFRGASGDEVGCPMFQHPFMVDNNRDCIFCGKCVKNCENQSILLNLRLAPQELWDIKIPRKADSFLIVALSAIFFPFAMHNSFYTTMEQLQLGLAGKGLDLSIYTIGSGLFFGGILLFEIGYYLMVHIQSKISGVGKAKLLPFLGYGFIPMVLGGYLAVHFEILVTEVWRLVPNFQLLFGMEPDYQSVRLLSPGATTVLQSLVVFGGLFASMYATYRIKSKLGSNQHLEPKNLVLPYSFLVIFTVVFLFML